MGAFLFYLFKSTLCLAVLYLLFRLCFRGDTLFRTNRFLLLGGTAGCLLLPLVQVDVQQDSLWQRPVAAVEAVLTEPFVEETSASGPLSETETVLKVSDGIGGEAMTLRSETSFGWVHLLAALYAAGAVLTQVSFLLSYRRMRQLLRRCPVRECGGCRLVRVDSNPSVGGGPSSSRRKTMSRTAKRCCCMSGCTCTTATRPTCCGWNC